MIGAVAAIIGALAAWIVPFVLQSGKGVTEAHAAAKATGSAPCTLRDLSGFPCRSKPLTHVAKLGWDGEISAKYAARRQIKAEAVSDSGYFGGSEGETQIRTAGQVALDKCKFFVESSHKADGETCSIIMLNENKVGSW